MTINRRRAPSSSTSSEKKLGGHSREEIFAGYIGGSVINGTQKADVKDKSGNLYSVKSGKKFSTYLKMICTQIIALINKIKLNPYPLVELM